MTTFSSNVFRLLAMSKPTSSCVGADSLANILDILREVSGVALDMQHAGRLAHLPYVC